MEDLAKSTLVNLGLDTPVKRFGAVGALGTGLEFLIKPSYAFDPTGSPRPWSVTTPAENSTLVPVGMVPAILGLVAGIFI